ncbi:hypothetical protein B1H19_31195 [Streptomyces gilvosporeus]|uniref:Uncharacterized protein n=1 Tax=Streptomyces gilvosporeus TaxID=553510 RepID=A0A1V0TYN3_9ACTN|nr:hypothetical protein B1H19_31195 [Streptomyces gilvosporeus]
MIAVMGHADLTPQTLKLLEAELSDRLTRLAQPGSVVLVRPGASRRNRTAARRAGVPVYTWFTDALRVRTGQ